MSAVSDDSTPINFEIPDRMTFDILSISSFGALQSYHSIRKNPSENVIH